VAGERLDTLMFLFGLGFLGVNLGVAFDYAQHLRRRPQTILAWRPAPGRFSALPVLISVGLAALIVYKLVGLEWPVSRLFGEGMMLAYYGYLHPLSRQIQRGFFTGGIRLDRGFVPWTSVTGLTWREDPGPVLIVVAGHQQRAGRLAVPLAHYGEARRILRDHIAMHDLHIDRPVLDLGGHDHRDDV
jgi:hypothetical protein